MPKELCLQCRGFRMCMLESTVISGQKNPQLRDTTTITSNPGFRACPKYEAFEKNDFRPLPSEPNGHEESPMNAKTITSAEAEPMEVRSQKEAVGVGEQLQTPQEPPTQQKTVFVAPQPKPIPKEMPIPLMQKPNAEPRKRKEYRQREKRKSAPLSPIHEWTDVSLYIEKVDLPPEFRKAFNEILISRAKFPKDMSFDEKAQYGQSLARIFDKYNYYDKQTVIPIYLLSKQLIEWWEEGKAKKLHNTQG